MKIGVTARDGPNWPVLTLPIALGHVKHSGFTESFADLTLASDRDASPFA